MRMSAPRVERAYLRTDLRGAAFFVAGFFATAFFAAALFAATAALTGASFFMPALTGVFLTPSALAAARLASGVFVGRGLVSFSFQTRAQYSSPARLPRFSSCENVILFALHTHTTIHNRKQRN